MYRLVFGGALPLLLSACASTSSRLPDVGAMSEPASASIGTGFASYTDPFEGYVNRPVTEPGNWRELNDAQSTSEGG